MSSKSKSKSGNKRLKDRLSAMKQFIIGSGDEQTPVAETEIPVGHDEEFGAVAGDAVALDTPAAENPVELEVSESEPLPEGAAADEVPAMVGESQDKVEHQEVNLEQIIEDLRVAKTVDDRILAVRQLGKSKNRRATPHLVAALFDDDPQVRVAAEEAMAQLEQVTEATAKNESVASEQSVSEAQPNEIDEGKQTSETPAAKLDGMVHLHLETGAPQVKKAVPPPELAEKKDANATPEEDRLIQELHAAKVDVDEFRQQILKMTAARTGQEKQTLWRIKREAKLRAEMVERIREEEEARKRAEDEAQQRRLKELEAIEAEQRARMQAEAEVQRLAEEESRLRIAAADRERKAEEVFQRHAALVAARHESERAAALASAESARAESEQRHLEAIEQLRQAQEKLEAATAETARQRSEVEAAREREEKEAAQLVEAQARMRTAEEVRAKAEAERAKQEAELLERVEKEERALAEARILAQQEHQRLAEELRVQQEARESALAAQQAEATEARAEAEQRNRMEVERLRKEEETLQAATEELARKRAEVEAARAKAEKEATELTAAHERMRLAEEKRTRLETERARVEAQLLEKVEKEERLLEETRQRFIAAQQRVDEDTARLKESNESRLAELGVTRAAAEATSKELLERERQLTTELQNLAAIDAETRKRISAMEAKKHAADQACKVMASQIQRLETETHASTAEQQRTVARMETEKRNAVTAANARAEHEKQLRAELEELRRQEDEGRNVLKALAMQRADLEAAVAKQRELLQAAEEARDNLVAQQTAMRAAQSVIESETARKAAQPVLATEVTRPPVTEEATLVQPAEAVVADTPKAEETIETAEDLPDAIASYLHSVDPYKRAAAVSEVARSKPENAFGLIVSCFDDQAPQVRNAAASALRALDPPRIVDSFNRALEDATEQRRRNIGEAIAGSGLATEAVNNLASESREATYNALSILFVMAKAGEIKTLVQAIEEHESDEVRRAVIKLLTLSGHSAAGDAALQRRVLGVAANRSRVKTESPADALDARSQLADAEVRRAVNGKHKVTE